MLNHIPSRSTTLSIHALTLRFAILKWCLMPPGVRRDDEDQRRSIAPTLSFSAFTRWCAVPTELLPLYQIQISSYQKMDRPPFLPAPK